MPEQSSEQCPQRELIETFAHDKVDEVQRHEAERLLEQNETCREYFRHLTAGRYPRLPNYTIIGQIGKGGFGVVYKAVHHAKERTEALKVLFSKTPLLTEYFQNEVHLIARLRHPNIATLYDAQLSTPPLYYTMEFVEGERLNDYLKRGEASLAERINLIKSVAGAVSYAHEQGVVHRDLKPQNILLDGDGQARVVDFGISIKLAEVRLPESDDVVQRSHEGPVGTIGYIAPEQEKGRDVDARADIYALGALLFHCVTGDPARLANVADQRIRILRERQIVQPEDLSAIIGRCVAESPDDRYASCNDFIADLDNYLAGRMIVARENTSIPYLIYRAISLVSRDSPLTVRSAVLMMVAGFLTWMFWTMQTRASLAEEPADRTVMIGFTEKTLDAIKEGRIGSDLPGLRPDNDNQNWRMLYGRLLARLAVTSPRVILIDSFMTLCASDEEFDQQFIDGLNASDTPVIIGALHFDINGEPMMCEDILNAVDGYGAMIGGDPRKHPQNFEVSYCIQRGLEPPIPGIALTAYAAWEHPGCVMELQLDEDQLELIVKYRKRNLTAKEQRTQAEEKFSLIGVATYEKPGGIFSRLDDNVLQHGDKLGKAMVVARSNDYWTSDNRTIDFVDVLTADTATLKKWFDDRAIVIGQMISGSRDEHIRKNGEKMFGCQVHAEAIDQLQARKQFHRFKRPELAARNLFWCGMGVIAVSLLSRRKWRSLRLVSLVCIALFFIGVKFGGWVVASKSDWVLLELLMAATGILTAGSLAYLTKAIRERQLDMSPSAVTMTTEGPKLDSTILAETR